MTRVWAHRGANRVARENTLAAFAAAADLGVDGVELDVWLQPDGRLVVQHDQPGAVVAADVPTLEDALAVCAGLTVNVEIKGPIEAVEPVLAAVDGADVVVSSFDLATIDRVRSLDPAIRTGFLLFTGSPTWAAQMCRDRGHQAVHPHEVLVDEAFMEAADGLLVHTWTVNDPARLRALADLGVDAVVTDVPDVALRVLRDEEPDG
jgi:glycerophosphoryl diester phosphodiesterase